MTILFEDWKISPYTARGMPRQYDDLSNTLLVTGELPAGYAWEMLVSIGGNLDILTLTSMTGGVGVVLTASMLSMTGYYQMQLRGTKGAEVKHSDMISVFIDRSLSGAAQWPTLPTEFTQAEVRIRAAASHYPYIGSNGHWFSWDVTNEVWVDTGVSARGATHIATVTIATTDWSNLTCTKEVAGVTASNIVIVDPSDASVECTGQGAGTLTFTAAVLPTATVTVKVVILS